MRALTIDAEFKALIPPLAPDERQLLEESILAEGCRDAIVVWHGHGIILDGHNRYDICTAHNIPFQVVERAFDTRADAKVWVLRNQLGRRNLPEPARVKLALLLKPALAEQARERQAAAAAQTNALLGRDTDETLVAHGPQASIGRARDKLAEEVVPHVAQALAPPDRGLSATMGAYRPDVPHVAHRDNGCALTSWARRLRQNARISRIEGLFRRFSLLRLGGCLSGLCAAFYAQIFRWGGRYACATCGTSVYWPHAG